MIAVAAIFMFVQYKSLNAQVVNNEGAVIYIETGAVVQGDTLENSSGTVENDGIIGLNGHYLNYDLTQGFGTYNIRGNWINSGTFISETSTVNFVGDSLQSINSGGDLFHNLSVFNTGLSIANNRVILLSNVTIANSFNFEQGNVETGIYTINLMASLPSSLNYLSTTGSRVIGKFERGINTPNENYLFPLGSFENYNPLNLDLNAIQNPGSLISEFVSSDPDTIGLWLPDRGYLNPSDSVEVYTVDTVGFWSLTANNSFTSNNYDINLTGNGFRQAFQNVTRLLKRQAGGNWILDGFHRDATDSVIFRDFLSSGISNSGNHYGWGYVRPRIQEQPEDTAICDGDDAYFRVVATGRGTLTYEWEVHEGSGGWQFITDNGTYQNSDTDTLLIFAADTSMNGYKYRVIITDSLGNRKYSNAQATLTVNPRPEVLATPQMDTICNGDITYVTFTSTEPATMYAVDVLYSGSILGARDYGEYDGYSTIEDTLVNPTLYADSVVYVITPFGPFTTHCDGTTDTVIIWVEPTVEITAVNDTICNGDETNIEIATDNITTNGIHYTWTATATDADVSGFSDNPVGQDISLPLVETLINTGLDSAIVHYTITPWTLDASGTLKCQGTPINIDVWVEPTVQIVVYNDTICDGASTNIMVTSPNTTTNGIRYTWTAIDNPNVTGESSSDLIGQNIGTAIIQSLTNLTNVPQLVQYSIVPWTVNASNINECTDINEVTTIDIWINPTPKVEVTVVRDTICNDTYTEIILTTPSVLTTGEVTFDYTSIADVGLSGNSLANDRTNGFVISDSLHNSTAFPAVPLVVRYIVTPRALAVGCNNGPVITDSVTVHPTPDTYMFADSVVCHGEDNGRVYVIAENSINQFTYNWDDPFNHQSAYTDSVLSIGTYRVTVTDNQSCTKIDSVYLGQPDPLIPYYFPDSIKNESCFNYYDGVAMVHPFGGNSGYTYQWDHFGSTDYYIDGLTSGVYNVTVTDWKKCKSDTTIQIQGGQFVEIGFVSSNVSCNGADDGWITASSDGAISYEWLTGETTAHIEDLSEGTYYVTVTNASGCKGKSEKTIYEPEILQIELDSTSITCAGDQDGTIDITVEGGTAPYSYSWYTSNGSGLIADQGDQLALSGGNYYITVTDNHGCVINDSISVGEPPPFITDIVSTDVTCFGDNDGTITITGSGGNGGLTYLWSNGSTDTELYDLLEGDYFVTVTDQEGCEVYDTAYINEPELLIGIISSNNISCYNLNDGNASIEISGGSQPYDINWSGDPLGQSTDSIYNLSQGNYSVTITDSHHCIITESAEITEPDELISNTTFENITCFGYNNGSINLDPTGGITPYTFEWSHDSNLETNSANGLSPGTYNVSVIDDNNCITDATVELTQPDPLLANVDVREITCYGFNDASISLTMFGGTPEYNYYWSNGYDGPLQDMIGPGNYNILITDQLGCSVDTTISIIEPEKLKINPIIKKPSCPDIQDGYIELNISGGRLPYSVYWEDGSSEQAIFNVRSGIYDVTINDFSFCEIDTTFVLRSLRDFCFEIPTAFTPNGDNINEKWEIYLGGLYPGVEIEIFDRWGKRVFYSKGYEESQFWDGTYNGKELPIDAYYYIINLKNGDERISGTVTIIR